MILGRNPLYKLWKGTIAKNLKRRRFDKMMSLVDLPKDRPVKVLEVGCANGKDFIQFAAEKNYEIWGVDIKEYDIEEKVNFQVADAANLPFEDKSFDVVVSVGLLEHIEPMEKLCEAIKEFERVGRHLVHVVPSVSTFIEPHCAKIRFPLRLHRNMMSEQEGMPLHLNFFTEHTWTKFSGFNGCNIKRFYYLPPFIKNTVIYK